MKKFICLLFAALTFFTACEEKGPVMPESYYSISGEISDADGDLLRLTATPILVNVADRKGQSVFSDEFSLTEEDRSFSIPDLPAGKYSLVFRAAYYEDLSCEIIVEKDVVQNATLKPIHCFTVDQTSLSFPPRVSTRAFNLTNTSGKDLRISFRTTKLGVSSISKIANTQSVSATWNISLAAGETRKIDVEVNHLDFGEETGYLDISAETDGQRYAFIRIPMSIVTDDKTFGPTVLGRVTDKQGKPLQGVLLVCDGRTMQSGEDGRYVFDAPFHSSMVNVAAYSEFYNYQVSEQHESVADDIEINFALEPCANHLTLDKTEVAFGTGSISGSSGIETIQITLTAEKADPVTCRLGQFLTDQPFPGFIYSPTLVTMEKTGQLEFTLSREVGNEGTSQFTLILTTDTAGTYFIPVSFTNTP
jgi:hypothetical protein